MCNDNETIAQDPISLSREGGYVSDSKACVIFLNHYWSIEGDFKSIK
jgi:hypothetical protein